MNSPQDSVLNKFAKITIRTEYVFEGKILEITPDHHIISTSNGKVMEVENRQVLKVEIKKVKSVESRA